ncbi:MAG: hypothetical protein IJJ26_06225 [Victivallales bacterium]|nr:hypothetical protein [Victivallales bacterium]
MALPPSGTSDSIAPGDEAPSQIWCSLELSDLPSPIPVPITATLGDITDAVTFVERDAYVFRTAGGTAELPMLWSSLVTATPDSPIAYEVTATGTAAACVEEGIFTFQWPADDSYTTTMPIPVHVPAAWADWEGTLDFTVTLLPSEYDEYLVVEPSAIDVHITCTTVFPEEDSEDFLFPKGVYCEERIPVCAKTNPTITVTPLPDGMACQWEADTSSVLLYGVPKKNRANVAATVTVDGVSHSFRWSVYDCGNRVLTVPSVGGYLTDFALAGSFVLTNRADGSVDVTLTTADGTRQGTAIGWQNGSTAGTLAFVYTWDDGATLHLEADADGSGTGVYTDEYGDDTLAVLFVPMEDATRFAGRYHVAYRMDNDIDGVSRGWTILEVSEDGLVSYDVHMYDDTTAQGTALLQPEANENMATLTLFVDLGNGRYLSTDLLILAPSIVEDGGAAVMELDDSAPGTAWFNGEQGQTLIATGVLYDSSRTLADVAGENNFTFLVEFPDSDTPAFVPNILVEEWGNLLGASRESLMSDQFKDFVINRDEGTFQGSFTFFTGEGLLTSHDVTFQGILTPISEECCGITAAVGCAYGYYTYDGKNYAVRVLPGGYSCSLPPDCTIVKQDGNNITWNVVATGQILCKRVLDDSYYGFVWQGDSIDIVLDGTSPYDMVALDRYCVESDTVRLGLQCGEEMTVYPSAEQGNKPGWKMVAIPWDVLLAENQVLDIDCFTMDAATGSLVHATTLERGHAYWIFSTDGNASLTFTAVQYPERPEPEWNLLNGWQMLAWDEAFTPWLSQTYLWNGASYDNANAPKPDQPVMLFLQTFGR